MDIYRLIVQFICGSVLLATIITTIIYVYTRHKILLKYYMYLLAEALNLLNTSIYFDDIVQTVSGDCTPCIRSGPLFYLQLFFYFIFWYTALDLKKRTSRIFRILFLIEIILMVIEAITVSLILKFSPLDAPLTKTLMMIHTLYVLPVSIYFLYVIYKLKKDVFDSLIFAGIFSTLIFTGLSIFLVIYLRTNSSNALGQMIFAIGVLIDIVLFSLALGYRGKGIWEDNLQKLNTINNLNYLSQLQITELDEKNRNIKAEEQKRLGQELHDDLANVLASIKMSVTVQAFKATDNNMRSVLEDISEKVGEAYNITRNKSHTLYEYSEYSSISFFQRVRAIITNVIPDELYRKEISIDDKAVATLPISTQIQLVKIIQEALLNILKHADAYFVKIIISANNGQLILVIADDGKGMNAGDVKKGIGLNSIKERAGEIGGTFEVASDKNGTILTVTLPYERYITDSV